MTQTITPVEIDSGTEPGAGVAPMREALIEDGLVGGRPVEDRSFEAVEIGAGAVTGIILGTAVAGPIGGAAGGLIGGATALVVGEALERHEGRAAQTTDTVD